MSRTMVSVSQKTHDGLKDLLVGADTYGSCIDKLLFAWRELPREQKQAILTKYYQQFIGVDKSLDT